MSDPTVTPAVDPSPAVIAPTPSSVTPGPDHLATTTTPAISAKTRTAVYVGCLIVNVLTVVGFGLAVLLGIVTADKASAAAAIIIAGINILATGLGVAYRPTRDGVNPA